MHKTEHRDMGQPAANPPTDQTPEFLTGRLLIAMPGIGDPRFERAVIFLVDHTPDHAFGLAVNRPVEGLSVPDLFERLGIDGADPAGGTVLLGGPVQRERGFVLHTDDYNSEGSTLPVADGIAMTTTREVLEAMADEARRPRQAVLALGYAGLDAGQLERELQDNVWLTCDADEALLFGDDHEHKWSSALAKLGVSAERLSAHAGRA